MIHDPNYKYLFDTRRVPEDEEKVSSHNGAVGMTELFINASVVLECVPV